MKGVGEMPPENKQGRPIAGGGLANNTLNERFPVRHPNRPGTRRAVIASLAGLGPVGVMIVKKYPNATAAQLAAMTFEPTLERMFWRTIQRHADRSADRC